MKGKKKKKLGQGCVFNEMFWALWSSKEAQPHLDRLMAVGFKDPWEPEGDRQSFQQHPGETLESGGTACMIKLELSHHLFLGGKIPCYLCFW